MDSHRCTPTPPGSADQVGAGRPHSAADPGTQGSWFGADDAGVLLVVEQLRRRVPGGIGTYISGLLHGLAQLEEDSEPVPDVELYASRPPRGRDPITSFGRPVRVSKLPSVVLTRAWGRAVVRAPRGYGVVHATSLAVPPVRRLPVVVTVHDAAWRVVPEAYPERGRRWHEAALERVLARAECIVVPSAAVAEDIARGRSVARIEVIGHGADHLPSPDDDGVARLLVELGVEGSFVLSVGTLEPRKNLERLFDAYDLARPALPGLWPLVVVGPSGWGPGVTPRAGVVLAGPVSPGALAGLYARAQMLVYVPLTEGFGLPPVEAMRLGTPVVASSLPSTGDAALIVDPRDERAIANAIGTLATDEGQRLDLVARGSAHAAALTWRDSARAHARLWQSLR